MGTKWIAAVRASKSLTVFVGDEFRKSVWSSVWEPAISEFNRLVEPHKLGVSFVVSDEPPDGETLAGANVELRAADGEVGYRGFGNDYSLRVWGTGLGAHTRTLGFRSKDVTEVARAFVFMPANPQIDVPHAPRAPASRLAGTPVLRHLLMHELVHCCGLDNAEHTPESAPDVFSTFAQSDGGKTPAKDRIRIGGSSPRYIYSPPITLAATTVTKIRELWT